MDDKKRKRGKRGSQKPAAVVDNAAEPVFKKTRRSKKGASAIEQFEQPGEQNYSQDIDFIVGDGQSQVAPDYPAPDAELRQYFIQIEAALIEGFAAEEDQIMFMENVLTELVGKEMLLATDFELSRILERLLKSASDVQIRKVASSLLENYLELSMHQFGSHVVQTIVMLAADISEREFLSPVTTKSETTDDESIPMTMTDIAFDICNRFRDHWTTLLVHSHGSHVARTILNMLSGESLVQDSDIRSKKSKKYNKNHKNGWVPLYLIRVLE